MPTVHNISNFKPEDYEVYGYYDNQPPQYVFGMTAEMYQQMRKYWEDEIRDGFQIPAESLGFNKIHKCVHCGQTNVRYVVSCTHVPTGERVCFGDVCVGRLGFRNHQEFKAALIRKKAAHEAAKIKVALIVQRTCEADADLKFAVETVASNNPLLTANNFARDIVSKLFQYGSISERQRECLINSVQKSLNPPPPRPEEAAPTASAPNGRTTIEGEVLSVKQKESFMGMTWKMLVRLDSGSKVWMSIPTNSNPNRGDRIRVTATFSYKEGSEDKFFAFGSRPTKLTVLSEAQPALANV